MFYNLCFCCICEKAGMVFESSELLAEWLQRNAVSTCNITPTVQQVNILFCTT